VEKRDPVDILVAVPFFATLQGAQLGEAADVPCSTPARLATSSSESGFMTHPIG
jgi:hypothetical protein